MQEKERFCFQCDKPLTQVGKVGRSETCPYCGADLHVCRNCRFYEPGAYNDCRESQAERVLDKERANFCDFFSFQEGKPHKGTPKGYGKEKLEELFRRSSS
jgi:hypothetical protein